MDLTALRQLVREAARQAFTALRTAHPSEHLYVYALNTDESVMTVLPAANSEEAWQRKVTAGDNLSAAAANYYRWASAEWAYEAWGGVYFQAAQEHLNALVPEDGNNLSDDPLEEDPDFTAFQEQVIATMTGALQDLDVEGFFGTGAARENVTLFVTMSDADNMLTIENASAEALNPAPVFEHFAARYA